MLATQEADMMLLDGPDPSQDRIGLRIHHYTLLNVLGRGQFGRVQLAINTMTQQRVAVKIFLKSRIPLQQVLKEVRIHTAVSSPSHPHIIQFIELLQDDEAFYLVMEWAGGGELFDLIEPDLGLEVDLAHFYFVQLVKTVQHLHRAGVAHRDLKPENLLLDEEGALKVSDFGLSTVYIANGRRRMLETPCGSPVYMAPEVTQGRYDGEAVDVWSCGVILYVMLLGNTPWEEPTLRSESFLDFRSGRAQTAPPWSALLACPDLRALLLGMLTIEWQQRWKLEQVVASAWFKRPNRLLTGGIRQYLLDRQRAQLLAASQQAASGTPASSPSMALALSQPSELLAAQAPMLGTQTARAGYDPHHKGISFSQPARDLLSSSQLLSSAVATPAASSTAAAPSLKPFASDRLTRFFSPAEPRELLTLLSNLLEACVVPAKRCPLHPMALTFTTVDRSKRPLVGTIRLTPVATPSSCSPMTLVSFSKTKGDPLEFKRFYKLLLGEMLSQRLVCDEPTTPPPYF